MGAGTPLRRILIDCTAINFDGQPSGIPRVVLAYVEVGYAWGRRNGVEVIPVVPTAAGVFAVRPLPGRGVPDALRQDVMGQDVMGRVSGAMVARRLRRAAAQWLALSLFHLAFAAIALLNIRTLWPFERQVRHAIGQRFALAEFDDDEGSKRAQIDIRPGDLMFCPAYWHDVDPAIYNGIKHRGATIVTLVHDILPIQFDRFYQAPWRLLFRDNVRAAFGYADALFCVSSYTGAAVAEFGHREKCPVPPVVTAYNGFEPLADAAYMAGYAAGETPHLFGSERLRAIMATEQAPYLMVGSIEPKKGHIPVIHCFEAMWRGGFARNLVIVGRPAWMCDGIVAAIEGSAFYGRKLFWLYDIPDFDLAYAYARAHALVFSSIGEGFGIPMVEASYYGRPTVVLDTPIAREVLGDIGLYFTGARTFVDRLAELEDEATYADRCRRARGLNWPTWSDYAPRVFDALRAVHAGARPPGVIPRTSGDPVAPPSIEAAR